MTSVLTPKSVSDLVKLTAKHGKRVLIVCGVDSAVDRAPSGKVAIDISLLAALQEISTEKNRVIIGTGVNLGRLTKEATGENGLIRKASSLIANPLVRNRVTLLQAVSYTHLRAHET